MNRVLEKVDIEASKSLDFICKTQTVRTKFSDGVMSLVKSSMNGYCVIKYSPADGFEVLEKDL